MTQVIKKSVVTDSSSKPSRNNYILFDAKIFGIKFSRKPDNTNPTLFESITRLLESILHGKDTSTFTGDVILASHPNHRITKFKCLQTSFLGQRILVHQIWEITEEDYLKLMKKIIPPCISYVEGIDNSRNSIGWWAEIQNCCFEIVLDLLNSNL